MIYDLQIHKRHMKYNCNWNVGSFKGVSLFTPANVFYLLLTCYIAAVRLVGNIPTMTVDRVKRGLFSSRLYSLLSPAGSTRPRWDSWGVGSSW